MELKALHMDGATLLDFVRDRSFVKFMQGCYGSGKTTALVADMLKTAVTQYPHSDNVRYTRFIWVRATKPELETTTVKTYEVWIPPATFGPVKKRPPMNHIWNYDPGDGTICNIEVYFLALDDPDDLDKLNSLEATAIYFNELREVHKAIVDAATGRVGRYPGKKLSAGKGTTYKHVAGDTNPADEQHWFTVMSGQAPPPEWMSEEERNSLKLPPNWKFFIQPPALLEQKDGTGRITGYVPNPLAENVRNHDGGFAYWMDMVGGKTKTWIDIYIMGRPGSEKRGRVVQDSYNPIVHRSKTALPIYPKSTVYIGMDFGLTPAALFGQMPQRQLLIQREIVFAKGDAKDLARECLRLLASTYAHCDRIVAFGDPSGDIPAQTDSNTPFRIMRAAGFPWAVPAPTNDFTVRVDTMNDAFDTSPGGVPLVLIDPSCTTFHHGLAVDYQYPEMRTLTGVAYKPIPAKTFASHIVEAGQYLFLGALGVGRITKPRPRTGEQPKAFPKVVNTMESFYARRRRRFAR